MHLADVYGWYLAGSDGFCAAFWTNFSTRDPTFLVSLPLDFVSADSTGSPAPPSESSFPEVRSRKCCSWAAHPFQKSAARPSGTSQARNFLIYTGGAPGSRGPHSLGGLPLRGASSWGVFLGRGWRGDFLGSHTTKTDAFISFFLQQWWKQQCASSYHVIFPLSPIFVFVVYLYFDVVT